MRGRTSGILALLFLLAAPAIGLAENEDLPGMWNIQGGGTLEIKDDGSFAGQPKDMDAFAGKWDVNDAGLLVLTRDDGMAAECKFTVTDKKLTLSECPASGEYDKSE